MWYPEAQRDTVRGGMAWAALSYVPFLCILVILTQRGNAFAMFHAKQALVLLVGFCMAGLIPFIGHWLLEPVFCIVSLVGFVEALRGEYFSIPLVADLARKIDI